MAGRPAALRVGQRRLRLDGMTSFACRASPAGRRSGRAISGSLSHGRDHHLGAILAVARLLAGTTDPVGARWGAGCPAGSRPRAPRDRGHCAAEVPRCSTPCGIAARATYSKSRDLSGRSGVVSALRHHGEGDVGGCMAWLGLGDVCSTPCGITARATSRTRTAPRTTQVCSTPCGITARATAVADQQHSQLRVVLNA